MGLVKILTISVIAWGVQGSVLPADNSVSNCDQFKVIGEVQLQGDAASIAVKTSGGQAPLTYIFSKESGHLVTENFQSNIVSGLSKGKYYCTVVDKNSCKKTIEIEIK